MISLKIYTFCVLLKILLCYTVIKLFCSLNWPVTVSFAMNCVFGNSLLFGATLSPLLRLYNKSSLPGRQNGARCENSFSFKNNIRKVKTRTYLALG